MIATPMVKKQLVALTVAAVVGVVVLGVVFLRVPEALGMGRYTVHAEFRQGAGIYEGAQVNYLGHPVGKVTGLELREDRIAVDLTLVDDVEVPADVAAEIHSRSAVGEQYVELVPAGGDSSGHLGEGDRIALENTSSPVEIGPVLDNVNALVRSLPRQDLSTLVTESGRLFADRDDDLQDILDGGRTVLAAADEAFVPTRALLRDAEPLLRAVNSQAPAIASFSRNLAQVTDELRAGDKDLRILLGRGPAFSAETVALLDDLGQTLPGFLEPFNAVTAVLATYRDHVAELLSTYPQALAAVQSVTLPELGTHDVRLTVSNADKPPACFQGFLPVSEWRSPFDYTLVDTPLLYCTEEAGDPRAVRGARNIPCPDDPTRRAPTPALCRP